MTAPFVILGTPRSRTAWLAKFLAFEGRKVLHEPSIEFRSINDIYALYNLALDGLLNGVVDSMLTFRWRDVVNGIPGARIVLVHRPMHEVVASFMRTGIYEGDIAGGQAKMFRLLGKLESAMDDLRANATVLSVPFYELASAHVCGQVFRYCLGEPMPERWWRIMQAQNVQADIRDVFRRAAANADGVRAVFPELTGIE